MQQMFVDAWSGNGAEAARAAGYAHPEKEASRLVRIGKVRKAIEAKSAPMIEKYDLSFDQIITKFAILARDSMDENVVMKAMDYINKMRAVYIQKHEVTANYNNKTDDEILEGVISELRARGYTVTPPEGN